jgi:hypothetical protein
MFFGPTILPKILNSSHHGFRGNFSTTTADVDLVDMMYEALDRRQKYLGVFIDLSKAFDLGNHLILLSRLYSIGIRGIANEWFRSYLQDQRQIVSEYLKWPWYIDGSITSCLLHYPLGKFFCGKYN